jgi:hypothetical protein
MVLSCKPYGGLLHPPSLLPSHHSTLRGADAGSVPVKNCLTASARAMILALQGKLLAY